MCGIFGSISLSSDNPFGLSQVPFIIKSLNQRGPDNSGHFIHKNILLVHTRLSIIDTSQNGNQPMEDESGRYVRIYNGEKLQLRTAFNLSYSSLAQPTH